MMRRSPPPIARGMVVSVNVSIFRTLAISRPNRPNDVNPISPTKTIKSPMVSPDCSPEEKNKPLPARDTKTPNNCQPLGLSSNHTIPPINIKRGDRLIKKETVVAGKYFKPQNKAPFPMVYALIPMANKRSQSFPERGSVDLPLRMRKGSRIKKPKKYRKPAIVKGPRQSKPTFTKTKEEAQIAITDMLSMIAAIRFTSMFEFAFFFIRMKDDAVKLK
jgi:hypothetical protein